MKTRTTAFYLLCAGMFLMLATSSFGQLTKLWTNSSNSYLIRHDTDYIDYTNIKGNKLQFDASGNCYFFSQFNTLAADQQSFQAKMQTIKYSSSGSTVWTHRDSGTTFNQCYYCGVHPQEMIVNSDGTSYGVARDGFNYSSAFLTSTKPTGVTNWNHSKDANGPEDIVEDIQGNVCFITNSPTLNGYGEQYIILSKINPAGNTNWTVYHSSPDGLGYTADQKIVTDKYSNFYVAASTYRYGANGGDVSNLFITKFDSAGTLIWEKRIDSARGWEVSDGIYNLVDSSIYLSYYSTYVTNTDDTNELKLVKVSNMGNVNWTKLQSPSNISLTKLKQDNQGNVYWWFSQVPYGESQDQSRNLDGNIIKYNSAGSELGRMSGNSFDVDASGYTYVTHELGKNHSVYDAVKKYSPNGLLLYDSPIFDYTNNLRFGGYYSEVYKDKLSNIYTLSFYDSIRVSKFSLTCSATVAPVKPKSITGYAIMYCDGSSYNYSCPAVSKAIYYNWTVPNGVIVDSGQGITKLYVHHYTGFKTGQVSVYASNCFGASAAVSKAVTDTLKSTTKITGATSVCKGQTNVQYTAQAVAGAINYQWTIPAGATFSPGYGSGLTSTPVVQVNFGNTSGKVSVMAMNYCDSSVAKSLQVKVTACIAGMTIEAEENKATIYPNPSSGAFTLRIGNAGKNYNQSAVSVMVKDVSGKVVEEIKSVTAGSVSFGSRLVPGVYFVEVITGSEKQVLKVVKE